MFSMAFHATTVDCVWEVDRKAKPRGRSHTPHSRPESKTDDGVCTSSVAQRERLCECIMRSASGRSSTAGTS